MNRLIGIGLVALVGMGLAVQSAANAKLGAVLRMPLAGALWNFVLGSLALGAVLLVWQGSLPSWQLFASAPRWSYVGGVLGACFVTASILAVPRYGVTLTFAAIIFGQLLGALILDHFGWLGVPRQPASATRLFGVLLLAAGVVLTVRR
jgi:Uncharacterized protein conserved in bacteria